jgi:hypothetical protein
MRRPHRFNSEGIAELVEGLNYKSAEKLFHWMNDLTVEKDEDIAKVINILATTLAFDLAQRDDGLILKSDYLRNEGL